MRVPHLREIDPAEASRDVEKNAEFQTRQEPPLTGCPRLVEIPSLVWEIARRQFLNGPTWLTWHSSWLTALAHWIPKKKPKAEQNEYHVLVP